MIHSLEGDLLLSKAELLAHGVAPNDDFKQGLALALREKFPAMYKDFRHHCHQSNPKCGTVWLWQGVGPDGKQVKIAALVTQEPAAHEGGKPGKARTEHVNHALHELKKLVEKERIASVALPALATGVGGLEWRHVEPLIQTQLKGMPATVCLYAKYVPKHAADEPIKAVNAAR
jgi:O-acetyl-ADP-ribose deacetylase (regulator of RNase III)